MLYNEGEMTTSILSRKEQYQECHRRIGEAVAEAEAEAVRALEGFVMIGQELTRMKGLYDQGGYKTFEEYCKAEWGWTDRRAQQLMRASEIRPRLPELPAADEGERPVRLEWTEWTVRPLLALEPPDFKKVCDKVVKEVEKAIAANEKPSLGGIVRRLVKEVKDKKKEKELPDFSELVQKWGKQIRRMSRQLEGLTESVDWAEIFVEDQPGVVKSFTEALEQLQKAWEVTKPVPAPRKTINIVEAS